LVALLGCSEEYVIGSIGLAAMPGAAIHTAPLAVALGDLDGDDAVDAAYVDATPQLCTLRGHSDGTLTPESCVPLAEPAAAVGIVQLGEPGHGSLLVAGSTLTVYAVEAAPGLRPTTPVRYPLTGSATALLLADVQGDGTSPLRPDLRDVLVSDGPRSEVAVFRASPKADGSLQGPQRYPVDGGPVALLFDDLDGDKKAELVTANRGPVPLTILSPGGVATFSGCSDGRRQPLLARPRALAALDLDHNRRRVLIVADAGEAAASLRLFRATSEPYTFDCGEAAQTHVALDADPVALARADFDGDGSDDLVVAHGVPPHLSLFLGGPSGLLAPLRVPQWAQLRGLAVADLDHDGRPDIVVASSSASELPIVRNTFP
jgi:hypothetical protein